MPDDDLRPHELLADFREKVLQVSQRQLAAQLEIDRIHLSRVESGARGMGLSFASTIFDAYRTQFAASGISFELFSRYQFTTQPNVLRGDNAEAPLPE